MGGYRSTRWSGYERKTTVEECLVLLTGDLGRNGISENELNELFWIDHRDWGIHACLFYTLDLSEPGRPAIWMTLGRVTIDGFKIEQQRIKFESTVSNRYGGVRWWFTCPSPGEVCGHRRCEKLYLRPGGLTFACRECHDLTYLSYLESYPYDPLLRAFKRIHDLMANLN